MRRKPEDGLRMDCLIFLGSHDRQYLGKRYLLEGGRVCLGRGKQNDIVLVEDSVSRRHCHLEYREHAWFLVDDGSTNGTYLNDELVHSEARLDGGDRLKIGKTTLKFLSGTNLDRRYHEEIDSQGLAILDPVTKTYREDYFKAALASEIELASRLKRPLTVLMIEIDHFAWLKAQYGYEAAPVVLEGLARIAKSQMRRDEIIACFGLEKFAVMLPATDQPAAFQRAESLRTTVAGHEFLFQKERIRTTISIGCASLDFNAPIRPDNQLLGLADNLLYEATRLGRNCTQGQTRVKYTKALKRVQDGRPLFDAVAAASRWASTKSLNVDSTVLQELPYKAVLAFEIDNEAAIHLDLGARTYDKWLGELIDYADEFSEDGARLGLWRDRFLFVATRSEKHEAIARKIVEAWSSDAGGGQPGTRVARALKTSVLTKEEILREGERGLDVLVARLTRAQRVNAIPYPFAVLDSLIASFRSAESKSRRLVLGMESATRFFSFIELASIRDYGNDAEQNGVAKLLVNDDYLGSKALSFGHWEKLARGLARFMPANAPSPVLKTSRNLFGDKESSLISESVTAAVTTRNDLAHGGVLRDERSYEREVRLLLPVWDQIVGALAPLRDTRLVSVDHIAPCCDEDEEATRYVLHEHTGPSEIFPVVSEQVRATLLSEWCYLLIPGGEPLSLAPFVFARSCESCQRIEVYVAERIVMGPSGTKVKSRGIPLEHKACAKVPVSKKLLALHNRVEAVRQGLSR